MGYRKGQTALVLPVVAADRILDHWRSRHDPSAAGGMPAHITVLAPFLDAARVGAEERTELAGLFAAHAAIEVQFRAFGALPGILYLDPFPRAPIVDLIDDVRARWLEAQSSGGELAETVPHLTIATAVDPVTSTMIEGDLADRLPVRATLESAALMAFADGRWSELASFALAG
jgi:hypothetical protein